MSTRRKIGVAAAILVAGGALAFVTAARAAAPSPSSVTPKAAQNTAPVTLAVTGTGFEPGATAALERTGHPDVAGADVSVLGDTALAARFDIRDVAPGRWDLRVTNPDQTSGACAGCFTVAANAPDAQSVEGSVGAGAERHEVLVNGANIFRGARVTVTGGGVDVVESRFVSTTTVAALLDVAADAVIGRRDVTVTNTDGQSDVCSACLVVDPAPDVVGTDPATLDRGAAQQEVTVKGIGFVDGATVDFGGGGVTVHDVAFRASTAVPPGLPNLVATVSIARDAVRGPREVVVRNPDGGTGRCAECFSVLTDPRITSVAPASAGQGARGREVTIRGANFADGAVVRVLGEGVSVRSVEVQDGSRILADVDVAGAAPVGERDLEVRNPDGDPAVCSGCLTVNAGPAVSSVDPASRGQGAGTQQVAVAGSGFATGARVTISGTGVAVTSVSDALAPVRLVATLEIERDATAASRDVSVINPDGGATVCDACFTVNGAPDVESLTPSSLGRGASSREVVVSGSDFLAGATAAIAGVTVDRAVVDGPSRMRLTLTVPRDSATGARDVTVTNPDGGVPGSCTDCFSVNAMPTVTGVTPSSLAAGTPSTSVTVAGTGFRAGADVSFGPGVTVETVNATNAALTVMLAIPADSTPGPRDVTVANGDGAAAASCAGCFTVNGGLDVTSVVPEAAPNTGPVSITVAGDRFAPGASLRLEHAGQAPIAATNVIVESAQRLRGTVDLTGVAPVEWDVRVTNPGVGATNMCRGCFTAAASAPTVAGVAPTAFSQGAQAVPVAVTGSGFANGASVTVVGSGVTLAGTQVRAADRIEALVTVARDASATARDVLVRNADGQQSACRGCLRVREAPVVSDVSPAARGQGADDAAITIEGHGFDAGSAVAFTGGGITVGAIEVRGDDLLVATIDVAGDAAPTRRDIVITNPDKVSYTCAGCFAVTATPTVASAAPASRGRGAADQIVVLTGTGFGEDSGATISGEGVDAGPVEVVDATHIRIVVDVARDAALGARDVRVSNPDGGSPGVCRACFTVLPGPAITAISPNARGQGAGDLDVTVSGNNLQDGADVVFSDPGIAVRSVRTQTPLTSLVAAVTVPLGATPGRHDATVVNADGGRATCDGCFTVTALPVVTTVTPSARGTGTPSHDLVVQGSGFQDGATLTVTGEGVTVSGSRVDSPAKIVSSVTVAADAAPGPRDVRVTNPDGGGPATCTGCFTVNPAPRITSIDPSARGQGARMQTVTIRGANFGSGIEVTLPGDGVSIHGTQPISSTETHVMLSIARDALVGPRSVVVTNVDGGFAICDQCFTVSPGPQIAEVSPRSVGQGADGRTLSVTGSGFAPGATLSAGAGVVLSGISVPHAAAASATMAVDPSAEPDARDVRVINPDGGQAVCAGCLTVTRAPSVRQISPNVITQGTARDVTVDGIAIQDGATLALSGAGVNVGQPAVADSRISARVDVAQDAALGPRDVTVANPDGGSVSCLGCVTIGATRGRYTAVDPTRILDTRDTRGTLAEDETLEVPIAGQGGVPASGVSAVAVNVTVTEPTEGGYLTLFPAGEAARPNASNLNFAPGQTVANLAVVKLGRDGRIAVYNAIGRSHVILDVAGWYDTEPRGKPGRFVAVTPTRVLETRRELGGSGPFGHEETRPIRLAGSAGVPDSGATAVVLNATVVRPDQPGFLTIFPTGRARPNASNLNFAPGDVRANRVLARLGNDGTIDVFNALGTSEVLLDVVGYITGESAETDAGGALTSLPPARILDTRDRGAKLGADSVLELPVRGAGGVPDGASAVVLNLTATEPSAETYLTVFGAGNRPSASDLNARQGQTAANLVLAKIGDDGSIRVFNASGSVHVIVDVVGWID